MRPSVESVQSAAENVALEKKFQRQLALPRASRPRGGNKARCRKRRFPGCISSKDLAEGIVYRKVGVIENVEKLPPELQASAITQLLDRYIFSERKIEIKVPGPGQYVSSRSSQEPSVLECKGGRVEVAIRSAENDAVLVPSGHEIRAVDISSPLSASAGVHARAGAIGPQRGRERVAALNGQDRAGPPTVQDSAEHSALEWLRQLINRIELPVVPQIEVSGTPVNPPIARVY